MTVSETTACKASPSGLYSSSTETASCGTSGSRKTQRSLRTTRRSSKSSRRSRREPEVGPDFLGAPDDRDVRDRRLEVARGARVHEYHPVVLRDRPFVI